MRDDFAVHRLANDGDQFFQVGPRYQRQLKVGSRLRSICRFEALSIQQDHLNGNNPGKANRNELFQNMETFTAAAN